MYQNMFKVAQETALQRRNTGQCAPNDTVCVICSATKQTYTGVSHNEMQNGMMVNVHAELDALQQMRAVDDTVAEFIMLIDIMTLQPILPCNNCVSLIIGQAPANANCQVVLPDRMIPLSQVGTMNGGNNAQFNQPPPQSGYMYGNNGFAGQPQGGMYGTLPQGNMYGTLPQGNMYGGQGGSMYNNSMPYNEANPVGGGKFASSMYSSSLTKPTRKAGGSLLKNKVGGLVNAGKDIGNDEKEESALMKKLFKK